ncbi:hypothetical protein EDD11_000816 [Mortierella claussenii]|nr:hypothetical protein EDD11_000816 [Mortierella claussenii]
MTTSSISEPETGKTLEPRPLIDRKPSTPTLDTLYSPTSSTSFFSTASSSVASPSTLASPYETEFGATVTHGGTTSSSPTVTLTSANGFDNSTGEQGIETIDNATLTRREDQQHSMQSTYINIQLSIESAPAPPSIPESSQSMIDRSLGQKKDAASYVPNCTHDMDTTTTSTAAAEADLNRRRRAPHLQLRKAEEMGMLSDQHEKEEEEEAKEEEEDRRQQHDNVTLTTPTTATSSHLEGSSSISITNDDMDMSMTSPAQHTTKSPPNSSSSTSSSASTGRRNIAESSMILSAGTGPMPLSAATITKAGGGGKQGSLSPAWSMTSIPRDISSTYSQSYQDPTDSSTTAALIDEKLYGLVDRYGFLVEEGRTPTADKNSAHSSTLSASRRSVRAVNEARMLAKRIEKEQERSLKWAKMARQYTTETKETEYSFSNHSKFVPRVYKGIPDCWRAAAWTYLITKRSAGFEPNIRQIYHDMLDISSPEEEQIDLDIPRTMHGHIMFRTRYGPGQCSLFKVLKAYSNYNHRVGYCQGMASVVATMLTFFDEEKTFVLLAQLFDCYGIKDLVVPGFPALFEAFYIQEELTKIYAPKVFEALETMGIATPSYASRWYITLYSAGVVPYRTLLRIWDMFLLEGFDWLYFMALALLKYHEPSLVQNNFEQTMEMLNAKMDIQDDDMLLKIARKLFKQARQTGIVAKLKEKYAESQRRTAIMTQSANTTSLR